MPFGTFFIQIFDKLDTCYFNPYLTVFYISVLTFSVRTSIRLNNFPCHGQVRDFEMNIARQLITQLVSKETQLIASQHRAISSGSYVPDGSLNFLNGKRVECQDSNEIVDVIEPATGRLVISVIVVNPCVMFEINLFISSLSIILAAFNVK